MKIICLGDMACPEEYDVDILKKMVEDNKLFKDKIVIANLEGLLVKNEKELLEKYNNALFNNEDVIEIFKDSKKTFFSLANNHIKDIPEQFEYTIEKLKENNIGYSGASNNLEETYKPCEFEIAGTKYAVFAHCWKVMSNVIKNKSKKIFLNDIDYKSFVKEIKEYKDKNKDVFVIVYFHWNFDFEDLPFPIHIDVAHKLIDNGVDIVLGGHSHLVNGGEVYKEKTIIYGFGNFYIPSNKFLDGKLKYPKEAEKNIILEYDTENKESKIYWIKDNNLEEIESLENGKNISEISKYKQMTLKEYNKYFKKNRKKKVFVPTFYRCNSLLNNLKEQFVLTRMKVIRFLKGIK